MGIKTKKIPYTSDSNRPVSRKNAHLLITYLKLQELGKHISEVCEYLDLNKPWFDD